jgi:lysophospholipase L1-like esterase
MNKKKAAVTAVAVLTTLALGKAAGYLLANGVLNKGNKEEYDTNHIQRNEDSPLNGKKVFCLGSSVTFGMNPQKKSFVEFLEAETGCVCIKEAVPGTTLADIRDDSYVSRLKKYSAEEAPDLFICQLSTNDATRGLDLGSVAEGWDPEGFDTKTVTGAIEYIISYVRSTWDCPVVFYTGTRYNSYNGKKYDAMVARLLELKDKWNIEVVDLYHDLDVKIPEYKLYMKDPIHPTLAGYGLWWTPEIREKLEKLV